MSTEVAQIASTEVEVSELDGLTHEQLAAMFGQTSDTASGRTIPKLYMNINPEMEIDNEMTEVPYKAFWFSPSKDVGPIFLKAPKLRLLVNKFMYRRWDADEKKWLNSSVMIDNIREQEAADEMGTTNCGKTQGFVTREQWDEMSKADQDWQKGAKLYRVVYAEISGEGVNKAGNTITVEPTLVAWYVGKINIKSVGTTISQIDTKRVLMPTVYINGTVSITKDFGPNPQPKVALDVRYNETHPLGNIDVEYLQVINAEIKSHNAEVMAKHKAALAAGVPEKGFETNFVDVDDEPAPRPTQKPKPRQGGKATAKDAKAAAALEVEDVADLNDLNDEIPL
jgi:hypothetical protein